MKRLDSIRYFRCSVSIRKPWNLFSKKSIYKVSVISKKECYFYLAETTRKFSMCDNQAHTQSALTGSQREKTWLSSIRQKAPPCLVTEMAAIPEAVLSGEGERWNGGNGGYRVWCLWRGNLSFCPFTGHTRRRFPLSLPLTFNSLTKDGLINKSITHIRADQAGWMHTESTRTEEKTEIRSAGVPAF